MTTTSTDNQKIRVFEPVILFHDHVYVKEGSHHLEHVHISYKDPQYVSLIEKHKLKTKQMLDVNGKYWVDGLIDDTAMINSSFHQISLSSSNQQANQNQIPSSSLPPIPTSTISLPLLTSSKAHTIIKDEHHHHHHHHYERRRRQSSISSTSSSIIDKKSSNNNNNNSNCKKRRGNLPRQVTSILREWLANHKQHPYPTDEEKLALAQQTHLTLNQVSNWFINARRRILITMLEEDKKEHSSRNNNNNNDSNNTNHSSKLIF